VSKARATMMSGQRVAPSGEVGCGEAAAGAAAVGALAGGVALCGAAGRDLAKDGGGLCLPVGTAAL